MTYENIDGTSSTNELFLSQKISLIADFRKRTDLTRVEQRQYAEIVQSLIPWAKKLLRQLSLPRDEDHVQEAVLQFLEIIDSGVERAYWIFEGRLKRHFREQNIKVYKRELKLMYEEQQDTQTQEESDMRLASVSLTTEEKQLMIQVFSMSRDAYCEKNGLSHRKYDEIVGNLKKKLGF